MAWGAASRAIRPEPAALPDTSPALPTIFQSLGRALVKLVPGDANSPRLLTNESHAFMQTILQQLYDWGLENYAQVGSLTSLADTRLGKTLKKTLRNMHDDVEFLIMQGEERSGKGEPASVAVPAAKRQAFQSYIAILKNFSPTIFRALVKGGLVTEEGEIVREGEESTGGGGGDGGEGERSERHVVRGEDGEETEVVFAEEDEEVDEEMGEEEDDDDDDDEDDDEEVEDEDEEMEEGEIRE